METIEAPDVIEFERRPDGLPKSVKQRYEEPRASNKREKKADPKPQPECQEIVADSKWGQAYTSAATGITNLLQQQTSRLEAQKRSEKKGKKTGDKKKFKLGFNL